jgi:hypothetical protein
MHDELFANQLTLEPDDLVRMAMDAGANERAFRQALITSGSKSRR